MKPYYKWLSPFRIVLFSVSLAFLITLCPWGLTSTKAAVPHIPIKGGIEGKSCYECHVSGLGAEKHEVKYGISYAYLTYMMTPHGRLRMLGDSKAPMCEDCHMTREWKDILPADHPDSPVHSNNINKVCANCHGSGMLTARVSEGSMHLPLHEITALGTGAISDRISFIPGATRKDIHYYIGRANIVAMADLLFKILMVTVILTLSVYVILDMLRNTFRKKE